MVLWAAVRARASIPPAGVSMGSAVVKEETNKTAAERIVVVRIFASGYGREWKDSGWGR